MEIEITRHEAGERFPAIPEQIVNSLYRYVGDRCPTGDFLKSVLCHDLFESMGRADEECLASLFDLVTLIYNYVPSLCHGTRDIVTAWLGGRLA